MGRGLLILLVFAAVLGALVYWGPLELSVTWPEPRRNEPSAASVRPSPASVAAVPRESQEQTGQPATRDPVLAVTGAPIAPAAVQPVAPAVTPPAEKALAGFPATPQTNASDEQVAAAVKQAKLLQQRGLLAEARDQLSEFYFQHRLSQPQRLRVAEVADPLSWELMTSHTVVTDGQLYDVQPGDVLGKLVRPFHVPPEFIVRINRLSSARAIRPRQTLRFVQGPFDVLVEPEEFELTVLQKGKFVRRFAIGIGTEDAPTPRGLFTVNEKLVKPKKWPEPGSPDRRIIEGGAPDNPLGSRWIGIGLGYGIHGTNDPRTIGQRASRGCIRMRNEDVELLFDMLIEGSRVVVR